MVEISCHVLSKNGNVVFNGFKNGSQKFESLDEFYHYMNFRYELKPSNEYCFIVSGREI